MSKIQCCDCCDEIEGYVLHTDLDGKNALCEECFQIKQGWTPEAKAEYLEWLVFCNGDDEEPEEEE